MKIINLDRFMINSARASAMVILILVKTRGVADGSVSGLINQNTYWKTMSARQEIPGLRVQQTHRSRLRAAA